MYVKLKHLIIDVQNSINYIILHDRYIYIFLYFKTKCAIYIKTVKKTKEESIKVDRKNDGTQKDISVDSVW